MPLAISSNPLCQAHPRMTEIMLRLSLFISVFASIAAAGAAAEIRVDFLMDREPEEKVQPVKWILRSELLPLWKKALAHPESEIKRQAAEAIVYAHSQGFAGMEAAIPELLDILKDEQTHAAARHAAARALIALDQQTSAAALFAASQKGNQELRQLVEPALARWGFEPIREIWRQRIGTTQTPRRSLILAIDGLGQQRDVADADALRTLVKSVLAPADIRLAAARSLCLIADSGQEALAEELMAANPATIQQRLYAATIIGRHQTPRSIEIRQKLGADQEPAVAGEALRTLFLIDPNHILPLVEISLANSDSNVRRIAIDTYISLPTPDRLKVLSKSLNDPHPQLRERVRNAFFTLSPEPALNIAIRDSAKEILHGNDWRGQEQAALLLGALDEESIAPRLIELLSSQRPEAYLAAAWSLKSLEVPTTAEAVLSFATQLTENRQKITMPIDHRLAHLFELLGRLKHVAATPLMERYIPKTDQFGDNSRGAAIWALGLIQEGQVNEPLARQLIERFKDTNSSPQERFQIRRASVLTLGRIRAQTQLADLKQFVGEKVENEQMCLTVRSAIQQISGESLPLIPPAIMERTGWFLEPSLRIK